MSKGFGLVFYGQIRLALASLGPSETYSRNIQEIILDM